MIDLPMLVMLMTVPAGLTVAAAIAYFLATHRRSGEQMAAGSSARKR